MKLMIAGASTDAVELFAEQHDLEPSQYRAVTRCHHLYGIGNAFILKASAPSAPVQKYLDEHAAIELLEADDPRAGYLLARVRSSEPDAPR